MQGHDDSRGNATGDGNDDRFSAPDSIGDNAQVFEVISSLRQEIDDQKALSDSLSFELARARSKPLRVIGDLLLFRLLSFLARQTPPLPAKISARAERKALKLHPLRTLSGGIPSLMAHDVSKTPAKAKSAQGGAGRAFDPQRATILLVTHEASRSGAPILALNIARILADTYNVVTVTLGGGPLRRDFREVSTATYELERRVMSPGRVTTLIQSICEAHPFRYALINSVESRSVLPALKAASVPTTILLHEFASYTKPRGAVAEVFATADQIVFSTRITLENALDSLELTRGTRVLVLPQGKCVVPVGVVSEADRQTEKLWLDSVLRPSGSSSEREFLVIGAGTVETRKGVDLFIECATRVIRSPGGGRFRFVWIGHGYRPDKDKLESSFLADQLARAGIENQVSIVRSTSEIEHAYRAADVLLLSSRLDPLPNVAIDALTAGTPVLCFERTTGIADFLIEAGLGQTCVAQYMDPSDMASKVLSIAANEDLRQQVISVGQTAAQHAFNLEDYVDRLDRIASGIVPAEQQIERDLAYLVQSGAFDRDFYWQSDEDAAKLGDVDTIRLYLNANRTGKGMRKPVPDFNPLIYAEANLQIPGADPYVHFLEQGSPEGPWRNTVIDRQTEIRLAPGAHPKIAVHLHVRDASTLEHVLARLDKNATRPDVFVSTVAGQEDSLSEKLSKLGLQTKPFVVPRQAGALGAVLTPPLADLLRAYEAIGQFDLSALSSPKERKVKFAFDSLIGGEQDSVMMDRIVSAMTHQPDLGIVMPADSALSGWGKSRSAADYLARRLGIERLPDMIDHPEAGAFWMRGSVLTRGLQLGLAEDDFPLSDSNTAFSVLEALPGLLCVLAQLDGQHAAVAHLRDTVQ